MFSFWKLFPLQEQLVQIVLSYFIFTKRKVRIFFCHFSEIIVTKIFRMHFCRIWKKTNEEFYNINAEGSVKRYSFNSFLLFDNKMKNSGNMIEMFVLLFNTFFQWLTIAIFCTSKFGYIYKLMESVNKVYYEKSFCFFCRHWVLYFSNDKWINESVSFIVYLYLLRMQVLRQAFVKNTCV